MRVITIEKRQYGQYVCKAANKLGTDEGRVELFGKFSSLLNDAAHDCCNICFLSAYNLKIRKVF